MSPFTWRRAVLAGSFNPPCRPCHHSDSARWGIKRPLFIRRRWRNSHSFNFSTLAWFFVVGLSVGIRQLSIWQSIPWAANCEMK